jgi:3-oxoacyl-[acyl-carrier protein] reductase
MTDRGLKGKNAIVTGGARGIGRACALALADEGANLAVFDLPADDDASVADVLRELRARGVKATYARANVTSSEDLERGFEHARREIGEIDILVNNAGITRDNLLLRMKDEEWDALMATNLTSAYRLSKLVIRSMMKARGGRIINITSVIGSAGNAGQTNYAAAKAGLGGFSRALAREIGGRNITVNCVAPGFIDTAMTRALEEGQRAGLVAQIPLNRLGSAEDVANAVVFLASSAASYITGATLHVNGGMYMA